MPQFVQVFWDGREIGTTTVRHKTLNPVWFKEPAAGKRPKEAGGAMPQAEEKPYFWLESTRSTNACLRVELYDWDAVGSHDFLGGVELDMGGLVELQRLTLRKARANGGSTDQQACRELLQRYATGLMPCVLSNNVPYRAPSKLSCLAIRYHVDRASSTKHNTPSCSSGFSV